MSDKSLEIVRSALAGFDLNDVETAVYGAALSLGPRQASKIAKKAGLNRAYTYDVLSSLAKKGLVEEVIKNNVKHFSPTAPARLVDLLENREQQVIDDKHRLLEALPKLEKIRNPISSQPQVRYFQGKESVREIFEDALRRDNQEIHAFLDFGNSREVFEPSSGSWLHQYQSKRVAEGVSLFTILSCASDEVSSLHTSDVLKQEVRVLPQTNVPFEVMVFGSRVAVFSALAERLGLVVDSAHIAEAVRTLHRQIWDSLAVAS